MTAKKKFGTLVVWLRRDLRVHDNSALHQACLQAERVVPLFVFDEAILRRSDTSPARVVFLLDALAVLDTNLQKCGGRLIVRRGKTPDAIVQAVRDFDADGVFFQREYEPHGRRRDEAVAKQLQSLGKVCTAFSGLTLFEPDAIFSQSGTPYTVFGPYKKVWFEKAKTADAPESAPQRVYVPDDARGDTLPTAADLRFSTDQSFDCGGEDAARALLDDFLETKARSYSFSRDILADDGTSRLSRHLHLGTIGPRAVVHAVQNAQKGADYATVEGCQTFLSELAWREFYLQILFHFPHVADGAFKKNFDDIKWENDDKKLDAWKAGKTGYPIVDAAMRQMNAEAWMHNRGRMIVASFLTKDLLIDWRQGERYFMEKLVDGDLAANNGGWQWAAGTGTDAQPFFRIFNPVSQGEKFDPSGEYVRKWVPELSRVPAKTIHQPWKLSDAERKLLGADDYPKPIVDHATQRQRALELYQSVTKKENP